MPSMGENTFGSVGLTFKILNVKMVVGIGNLSFIDVVRKSELLWVTGNAHLQHVKACPVL